MLENQREKNLTYVYPLNSVTSQFKTLKLSAKSRENKCPHCHKPFLKPSGLKAHIFSHTGEKPHKCLIANCGRYFSLLSNLRRHMKIHDKESKTKDRVPAPKRAAQKILPLLPVGPASPNQHDDGNQMDQVQQGHSSHGIVPYKDHACFRLIPLTLMEFSSLPVTPMEDEGFVFANNAGNSCDKKLGTTSSALNDPSMSNLAASNSYLPFDSFQLPTTQENLEDAIGQFHTSRTLQICPGGLEHPPWSTHVPNDSQFSIDELIYLENVINQYLPPHQFFYSQ